MRRATRAQGDLQTVARSGGAAGDGRVDGFIPGSYGYGGEGRHAVTEAVEEPRHDHHRAVDLAAEQLARAYRAQGLPSQRGRGPRGYTRADDRILDEINARLWDDPIVDASDIDVRCEQGRIVLEGHVPVRWMKHRAEDIADAVPGAKEVDNRIRVGAPDTDATATGAAAATQARSGESGIAAPMDRGAHGTAASSSSTGGPADATLPPLPQSPH